MNMYAEPTLAPREDAPEGLGLRRPAPPGPRSPIPFAAQAGVPPTEARGIPMRKLFMIFGAILILLVGVIVIAPFVIPVDTFKEQIRAQVQQQTGRELAMGDVRLSFFPRIAIEVDDVAFANAPGATAPEMATLKQLAVVVQVMPLLSGEVAVDRFVMVDPVINLEIDEAGKANWTFGTAGAAPAPASEAPASGGGGPSQITLGDVRLENGTLNFTDRQSGTSETLKDVNLTVKLPSLDAPMSAEGKVGWHDETVEILANVARPRALTEGGATAVKADVKSDPITFGFDGDVTINPALAVGGTVKLDVPSVRELAAWTGQPLDFPGEGFGPMSIAGTLDMKGSTIAFNDAAVRFDAINGTGMVTLDTGGNVPSVQARLDVETLDVNPYLPPEQEGGAASSGGGSSSGGAAGGGAQEWSDDPIDFSAMKLVNADLGFSAKAIVVREIKIGPSAVSVVLKDGRLVTELKEMQLYDGTGTGRIVVDASGGKDAAIDKSFTLSGVQAQPLLTDAADFDRLLGKADAKMAAQTRGGTERQLVSNLQGDGSISFLDGAIKGFNLAAMLRNFNPSALTQGFNDAEQTDFAELSGTYKITNGVLANDDLKMLAPLLRVTGAGTVDMPKRTVDYKATPKLVATIEGQSGAADKSGITVPMIITGPWSNVTVRPDLAGMLTEGLTDPSKIQDTVKGLQEGGTGAVKGLVDGITGGGASSESGTPAPTPAPGGSAIPNPTDALKGLFGK